MNPKILAKIHPQKIIRLKTEKDFTDLEVANFFQLLNNPRSAFIESKNQIAFAINSQLEELQIENSNAQTLSLFALNGPAQVNLAGKTIDLNKQVLCYPFNKKAALQAQKRGFIVCLDQRKITISNICLSNSCAISIKQGDLLCVINKIKID